MRYKPGHKEEARKRILEAAGRGFRQHGLGGIGVDGLAKEAGVTSGAFYVHFPSKAAAFEEAALLGLDRLLESIKELQTEHGASWVEAFVDRYLGLKRTCSLADACGLQALTPEVVRADSSVRGRYEAKLTRLVDQVAEGLVRRAGAPSPRSRAWSLLALLSGGVTLARSTVHESLGDEIAANLKRVALAIAN